MLLSIILLVASLAGSAAVPNLSAWEHDWATLLSSQLVDFGYAPYSDAQAAFLASHYAGVSIEKCSGRGNTEAVVYANARLVKAHNPSTKIIFYWDLDQGALDCYAASSTFMANPSWWLRDDAGAIVNSSGTQPIIDYTNAEARAWWLGVPLGGAGSPEAPWIDGVLADGAGNTLPAAACYHASARINAARCDALVAAKSAMVRELQGLLNATNGGVVLQNGLTYYAYPNSPADFGVSTLGDAVGVMNEHTAVFEQLLPSGDLNVTLVAEVIETVLLASALGKVIVLATWPGPLNGFDNNGPTWPGGKQPHNATDWKPVMLQKHTFASAFFMTVANNRTFMQYELWYNVRPRPSPNMRFSAWLCPVRLSLTPALPRLSSQCRDLSKACCLAMMHRPRASRPTRKRGTLICSSLLARRSRLQ